MRKLGLRIVLAAALVVGVAAEGRAEPVSVVAAEAVYGDIARQVGGARVAVTSILTNPGEDPHLFEASAGAARKLASARLVVANGAGYDPWIDSLLKASAPRERRTIVVADLLKRRLGDNPHLWADPAAGRALAAALADALAALDPAGASDYAAGAARFAASLDPLEARLAALRQRVAGVAVAASEPVFGPMADRLGLEVREGRFALAVMNGAEPSVSDIAAFEDDLKAGKVKAMIVNAQASEPSVDRLAAIARSSGVAVVQVSETEPPGMTYQAWLTGELDALARALVGSQ